MNEFRMEQVPGSREGVAILKLSGPFTLACVFDFQTLVRNNPAPFMIVDFTDVPYMDSAALGSVLGLHVSCQRENRHYALVGVSDRLRTLFRVAGVEKLLSIRGSVEEAEAAMGAAAAS
jgi:anti-anti-sigma factor